MEKSKLETKFNIIKKRLPIIISVCLFLLGLILGSNLQIFPQSFPISELRLSENNKFTNPILDCDIDQNVGKVRFNLSIQKIRELVNKKIINNEINYAAVYYRDLNNGPWYGINENELFRPASLIKIPVMIAFFKEIEADPSLANKKILFKEKIEDGLIQNYAPEQQLTVGQEYTIMDLIYRMIVYSDNQSFSLLLQNIDQSLIFKVLNDLKVEYLKSNDQTIYVSVKSYATLFRVLYNSSYLNRSSSEEALKILNKATFKKGILQGVPATVNVAHKFGEGEFSGQLQLHDCGIVYYPKSPYILCIMTRGQNWDNLSDAIGEIAKEIYMEIDKK